MDHPKANLGTEGQQEVTSDSLCCPESSLPTPWVAVAPVAAAVAVMAAVAVAPVAVGRVAASRRAAARWAAQLFCSGVGAAGSQALWVLRSLHTFYTLIA